MDNLKKLVNLGFGAWSLTCEKIEQAADELIKRGKINCEEKKKYVDELIGKIEDQKKEIENKIQSIVSETVKKFKYAKQEEIDFLKAEVEKLKQQITDIKKAQQKDN
ncbi:hypothetical protein J7L67_04285 [bacterium]|nr:hypothetical protein [bacterium]